MMLNVENINVYYGAIHAIKDVSFHAVSYTHLDVYKRQEQQDPHVATWFPLCLEWLKGL